MNELHKNLPNFFIIGAPKAGTTSLFFYLEQNPMVFMSKIKEPNFFSNNILHEKGLDKYYQKKDIGTLEEYCKLFKNTDTYKAIGEASVSYLYYAPVAENIYKLIPQAKIIIMLRNPIARAHSHYLMDSRLGFIKPEISFDSIVFKKTQDKFSSIYEHQYIELGFYYKHIVHYLNIFGDKQVKILFMDDLKKDINQFMLSVYTFLNVDTRIELKHSEKQNVFEEPKNKFVQFFYTYKFFRFVANMVFNPSLKRTVKNYFFSKDNKPLMNNSCKMELIRLYKEDVKSLESLLNRDLSHWLN